MEKLITRITLVPEGEPIFSEMGYQVEIDDVAGGEFVVVHCNMSGYDKIAINPGEWDVLKPAIDEMIKRCRG